MSKGRLSLTCGPLDQIQVARYIQYRAFLKYPVVVAEDDGGQWSHHGRYSPTCYQLVLPEGTLGVDVGAGVVQMAWREDVGHGLADYLAQDPIWGPDWLHGVRARG